MNTHLFVLVHGLLGTPNHMLTAEDAINHLVPDLLPEQIVCLRPSSFRFWHTYDGIELNALKVIVEIFAEIERLHVISGATVTKISIVGYSLGGLILRYIIGILHRIGFFDVITPVIFTTIATPHVGIRFFKSGIFDLFANTTGPFLFGRLGAQMFLRSRALCDLADPEQDYLRGLKQFQVHCLLANIHNDRTVLFWTSYITPHAPFERWNKVFVKYVPNSPTSTIAGKRVFPKFVDLTTSSASTSKKTHNFQEEVLVTRRYFVVILVTTITVLFIIPFWFPLVLCFTILVLIISFFKVVVSKTPLVEKQWKILRDKMALWPDKASVADTDCALLPSQSKRPEPEPRGIRGFFLTTMRGTLSRIMYWGSSDSDEAEIEQEDQAQQADGDSQQSGSPERLNGSRQRLLSRSQKLWDVDVTANDEAARSMVSLLKTKGTAEFPLFTPATRLNVDAEQQQIIDNLNEIDWIKIPVYLDCWNAHDGIMCRRGPKANPRGAATLALWCSIIRNHLRAPE